MLDAEIDEEASLLLENKDLEDLIPKQGPRLKLKNKLILLKKEINKNSDVKVLIYYTLFVIVSLSLHFFYNVYVY